MTDIREGGKGGTSLRLTSPLLDSQKFVTDFEAVTLRFIADAEAGSPLDVLVIDGWSEFDLMFEETHSGGDSGEFAKWNDLLSRMFSATMRVTPTAIGGMVVATARVMEKKKARQGKRNTIAGDPSYLDYDYYPSMRGSFRLHMPHYYNLVMYMETEMAVTSDGRKVPAHVLNVVRSGDFYVKNVWEHEWLSARRDARLVNPMWPTFWQQLTQARETYIPSEMTTTLEGNNDDA